MKKEQDESYVPVIQPNRQVFNVFALFTGEAKICYAGAKVRSRYGHPEQDMFIIGFTNEPYYTAHQNHQWKEEFILFSIDSDNMASCVKLEPNGSFSYAQSLTSIRYYAYTIFKEEHLNEVSDSELYCVCKFWDVEEGAFRYCFLKSIELEFIGD